MSKLLKKYPILNFFYYFHVGIGITITIYLLFPYVDRLRLAIISIWR